MEPSESHSPVVGYSVLVKVWAALLVLTLVLAAISIQFGAAAAVIAMLLITPSKASLVGYYFMDLRHESGLLKNMVFVTLGTLMIFITLLFSDFLNR
jgi:caa(3)-type oxidase subunit IV